MTRKYYTNTYVIGNATPSLITLRILLPFFVFFSLYLSLSALYFLPFFVFLSTSPTLSVPVFPLFFCFWEVQIKNRNTDQYSTQNDWSFDYNTVNKIFKAFQEIKIWFTSGLESHTGRSFTTLNFIFLLFDVE